MNIQDIQSYAAGQWIGCDDTARLIASATTGVPIARAGNSRLDVCAMIDYGRHVGGPAVRDMSFHDRAKLLKALALYLQEHKQSLYDISFSTGSTQKDHLIDIDGGIGTLLVFASKGRREMPDAKIYLDGRLEQLSRGGSFQGQHICTPLQGVAIHINAFNFPVGGMLEKFAPAFLAGMPVIVKPATASCHVTELCVRLMLKSGLLPKGALQLVSGSLGSLLTHLDAQDVVSFTGSATTALNLKSTPAILEKSIRFIAEQDSLNATMLGPDIQCSMPEFDLFVKEVTNEMTTKAGQKCTAIRRIFVHNSKIDPLLDALKKSLSDTIIGDPKLESTQMGPLISGEQKRDVLDKSRLIAQEAERVFGDTEKFNVIGADSDKGAFVTPQLFHCATPESANYVHDVEAFGPVATVMPYEQVHQAVQFFNRGKGSLVASVITQDADVAEEMVMGAGAFHGRIYFNNRESMKESTGHGSPLPHMIHGGPGRAGGGEEMGGIRGVMHYMQRTAIQGSPNILTKIGKKWVPGATENIGQQHPFTRSFDEITIGDTLNTESRIVSLDDIEHFATFTGDTFYAHMDDAAAERNPFFPGRVAHGYLLLSFAAGLFVQPDEGPVLANTGLDNLRFMKPVQAGDSIRVRLTVQLKTPRNDSYGEVRWHVTLFNQGDELVAEYELLTMNAYQQ